MVRIQLALYFFNEKLNILKQLNSILGKSATGKIQANIPFLSKELPEKLDVLGRTQERNKGIFSNLIDPSSTSKFTPTAFVIN